LYRRFFLLTAALAMLTATSLVGQTGRSKTQAIPRSPDGHPDLQGIWTNATLTQLERPDDLASKSTLSEQEAIDYAKRFLPANDRRDGGDTANRDRGYNALFIDKGTDLAIVDGMRRTSLIIDPPNGKIPPLTEEGKKRAAQFKGETRPPLALRRASIPRFRTAHRQNDALGFGSTSGPPMLPVAYNNTYQIATAPGVVMILVEMVHDVRIIHMDGRPHLPSSVRQWLGDSIGHWEGDMLVVETTNFTNRTTFRGSGPNLRVTERFMPVGVGTILYRATIDDPEMFTKPWTVEYPFLATRGTIFEYACHEGNYAMPSILGGARREDAEGIPNGK